MSREFQRATPVRKSVSAVTTSSGGAATLSTGTLVTCDTRSTSSPSARPISSTTTMRDDGVTTAGVRPRRVRISTTARIRPRRLVTPRTWAGT